MVFERRFDVSESEVTGSDLIELKLLLQYITVISLVSSDRSKGKDRFSFSFYEQNTRNFFDRFLIRESLRQRLFLCSL